MTKLYAVEAQEHFPDLLGRIREGETVLITEAGRPVAKLVPAAKEDEPEHLANVQGWLEDDDPFFTSIEKIIEVRLRLETPRRGLGIKPGASAPG